MKKLSLYLLLLLITACSLNAEQEASLHKSKTQYINGYNEGEVATYVAFTHPNAVAYYKNLGDSLFKEKYNLSVEMNRPFLQDGTIRKIESRGNEIHVKYEFLSIGIEDYFGDNPMKKIIYAISVDDGQSWFFVDEEDYFNEKIISKKDRLISEE